jgi:polar amino acid transport system substrate-binding protein
MKTIPCLALILLLIPAPSEAQELVWAGDAEGGAPYVFPDPRDPGRNIGFEVDLAEALAQRLGRQARFVQNQWDGLIPGLERGEYDVVINGLEITPERLERISFSDPYYQSSLTLTVRLDDTTIQSPQDLAGRTVGTLKATFAEQFLESIGNVTIRSYEGQPNPYMDLTLGRLDAVVMDTPIALYYGTSSQMRNIELSNVRFGIGIGIRKADEALLGEINTALRSLNQDGTLDRIFSDWLTTGGTRYRDYLSAIRTERTLRDRIWQYWSFLPHLLRAALVTLEISAAAMAIAIGLGLLLAILRVFGSGIVSLPVVGLIEVIRGTPLLIQLFIIFYGLPAIGIRFSPFWAAVIGLGLNYAAYEAENYRAGIQSIPKGQLDAAVALGLSRLQTIRKIILPQAMRLVIPPVTNDFIALLKDSSLVSVITMVELTKMYGQLAATYYDYIGLGILTAAMYFLLGLPIARLSRKLEERLAYMKA